MGQAKELLALGQVRMGRKLLAHHLSLHSFQPDHNITEIEKTAQAHSKTLNLFF
jgi:hypothetical protein